MSKKVESQYIVHSSIRYKCIVWLYDQRWLLVAHCKIGIVTITVTSDSDECNKSYQEWKRLPALLRMRKFSHRAGRVPVGTRATALQS